MKIYYRKLGWFKKILVLDFENKVLPNDFRIDIGTINGMKVNVNIENAIWGNGSKKNPCTSLTYAVETIAKRNNTIMVDPGVNTTGFKVDKKNMRFIGKTDVTMGVRQDMTISEKKKFKAGKIIYVDKNKEKVFRY